MLGAIIGDIVGSRFEFRDFKSKAFELFHPECDYTDDTICTVATADWLMNDEALQACQYQVTLLDYCRKYPNPMGGYGGSFARWIRSESPKPYGSFGNGSAMRVSPIGWFCNTLEETLDVAERSATVTHNHPEGVKGAQAVAVAIFLARFGKSKEEIKEDIVTRFGYELDKTCDQIRPTYQFNETCQGTVPQAITAFLDSTDFEEAIRLAVSLGGDSDTLTCITGAIAEAYYGIPDALVNRALQYLPEDLLEVCTTFRSRIIR
ncbi:MAG: ADP-ribosylglycohydrolase family protein [Bacteroidota bacterium]|nr:ADP-ribosylglycohydrolase family protein [Bacteroidota bacterium]